MAETVEPAVEATANLPEGFQITELGPLPQEWRVVLLGDLFHIQQGKALSPKHRTGQSARPFLRTANVYWGRIDIARLDYMDFNDEEAERLALQPGDLLVCEGGDIGRTAMWEGQLPLCLYQNHLHRLRSTRTDVEPAFYMYWMQAAWTLLNLYGGVGNKTTIPNLSRSRLASFAVPLPPLEEQRAITHILRAIQRAKEATEKVIAAARELKKSLMRHLFTYGPVPLEEAGRVPLKETEIGRVPEYWKVVRLGEVSRIRYGLGQPPEKDVNGIPMIRATNVKRGKIVREGLVFVNGDGIPASRDPYLKAGDIIVVRSGAYTGDVALVTSEWDGSIAGYDLIVSPKEELDSYFCVEYLLAEQAQSYFRSQRDRSAQPHLNSQQLRDTLIPLPPLPEQQEIARLLAAIDRKIQAEEARMQALDVLFKTLLHQLMTGKVRVKDLPLPETEGVA